VTKIEFDLYVPDTVVLQIFDDSGKELSTLLSKKLEPGKYQIDWNAENIASGVYFYQISIGDNTHIKKMLLIK
jgi:hypothetical protein